MQALVNAFYKTLNWIEKATPEQIADNVPQEYWLGDKALYMAAVKANCEIYSRDGIVSDGSQQRSIDFLQQFDKEIAAATIDPAKTWDDRFVKKAAATRCHRNDRRHSASSEALSGNPARLRAFRRAGGLPRVRG